MTCHENHGLEQPPLLRLWHNDGRAVLLVIAATLVIGCGVFIVGRCCSVPADRAALMTLFAVTVWVAVAAAPLAAGASTRLGALCRGGAVVDASIVTLIVLVIAGGGQLSWDAAVKVYLLWAGLTVTAILVIPRGGNRLIVAAVVAAAALAAISGRFWSAGVLEALTVGSEPFYRVTGILAAVDVLGGVADAASSAKSFVWAEQPVMYQLARQGQDYPGPSVGWWAPALTWWLAAAAIAAGIGLRRAIGRFYHGT